MISNFSYPLLQSHLLTLLHSPPLSFRMHSSLSSTLLHSLSACITQSPPLSHSPHAFTLSPSLSLLHSLTACIAHSPPLTHSLSISACITHSLRASCSQIPGSQNLGHTISRIIPILRVNSVQWCCIMSDTALRQQMETV